MDASRARSAASRTRWPSGGRGRRRVRGRPVHRGGGPVWPVASGRPRRWPVGSAVGPVGVPRRPITGPSRTPRRPPGAGPCTWRWPVPRRTRARRRPVGPDRAARGVRAPCSAPGVPHLSAIRCGAAVWCVRGISAGCVRCPTRFRSARLSVDGRGGGRGRRRSAGGDGGLRDGHGWSSPRMGRLWAPLVCGAFASGSVALGHARCVRDGVIACGRARPGQGRPSPSVLPASARCPWPVLPFHPPAGCSAAPVDHLEQSRNGWSDEVAAPQGRACRCIATPGGC